MEQLDARFLRYVAIDTKSDEQSASCPSTSSQKKLGQLLTDELKAMGLSDARMDENGYVYATLPANTDKVCPAIGLIAHMDTVDCVPSAPVKARKMVYQGGDITLNEKKKIVMREKEYDVLLSLKGQTLIVTDGTTLLGADDKAGVAEIMALCEYCTEHPEFHHGKICVGFTPDEEIGRGADLFDVAHFGADFAYTVDGGSVDEMEYENFNAASAVVEVKGFSIHPGSAKDKMKNAATLAMEFHSMLPEAETPEHTEGYEGFYHLGDIAGQVDHARLSYIIRDHDMEKFEARKAFMTSVADYLNQKYGQGTFTLTLKDSYFNMKQEIEKHPEVIARAQKAIAQCGLTPKAVAIRGGTDGARLSFMGLPCPNLGTGGGNGHGVYEYVSVNQMEKMLEILRHITEA